MQSLAIFKIRVFKVWLLRNKFMLLCPSMFQKYLSFCSLLFNHLFSFTFSTYRNLEALLDNLPSSRNILKFIS